MKYFAIATITINGCLMDAPERNPEPKTTRQASTQDPRCYQGGKWDEAMGACQYPDMPPPGL